MIAFFCSTPYHVLVATWIHKALYENTAADIYLLDHFKDSERIHHALTETGLFRKVKLIHSKDGLEDRLSSFKPLKYLQRISTQVRAEKIAGDLLQLEEDVYEEILFGSPVVTIQLALKVLYRRNPEVKIRLFEDGFAGYNTDQWRASLAKKLFNRISGQHRYIDRYTSLLLFQPELFTGDIPFPIDRIPSLNLQDKNFKTRLNTLFGYTGKSAISERVIFFEQPIQGNPALNDAVKHLIERIPTDDVIVKPHPRSSSGDYHGRRMYQGSTLPWEILAMNMDIENKILISFFSTVAITNKIIFDKEPTIILLFEMEELKKLYPLERDSRDFIYSFKQTYRYPQRILLPTTETELNGMVRSLLK
ncbi:MAG: hypothetical protein JXK93_11545 [Sphaerochaetaceae bacterium]|nr:hypothetical protein [Sphaerochaetaceae bacterium]